MRLAAPPTARVAILVALLALGALVLGTVRAPHERTSDAKQVTSVARTYEIALLSGDGDRACGQLTPQAQRQLVQSATAAGVGLDCRQVAQSAKAYGQRLVSEAGSRKDAARMRRSIQDPPVKILSLHGDHAVVRLPATMADPMSVVRTGDGWRIADLSAG